MKILLLISVLSFCALAWATLSIARHIRRNAAAVPLPATPTTATALAANPKLSPSATRVPRYTTGQRHDRNFSSQDAGNLKDPAPRAQVRPGKSNR